MNIPTSNSSGIPRKSFLICVVSLSLLAGLISWYNYKLHFNGFALNDYHEYCQIARNFYEGNGYSTSVLRPIAYKYFNTLPQPEVTRMPVYPFFLSLFFRLFGPSDSAVVLFNSLCYVVLIVLIFMVAFELSKDIVISLFAAMMTAFMESFLFFTLTAEPNVFYAAAITAFFYFYLKYPGKILLQGIFLGVLYQLTPNTLFVFLGFLIALFATSRGWSTRMRVSLVLIIGYAIGLVPYMVRNYFVVGKPLFSLYQYSLLLFTKDFPQYTIWTQITNIDPKTYALSHPLEMISKSIMFLKSLLMDSISFYKPIVLLMIGSAFFFSPAEPRLKFLRTAIFAGMVVQLFMLLPVGSVPYYYMFFFPLIIATELTNLKRYLTRYTYVGLSLAVAVFIWTTVPYWKEPKPFNGFISIARQVADATEKNAILLTDIPWEMTWYADRRTIWLPYDLETLKTISTTLKPRYMLLTGRMYAAYGDNSWARMLYEPDFAKKNGYSFIKTIQLSGHPVAALFRCPQ